jgi:hypothetical protein
MRSIHLLLLDAESQTHRAPFPLSGRVYASSATRLDTDVEPPTAHLELRRMSVTQRNGTKIVLHRTGPDAFWDAIDSEFQPDDERTWRYLAMLALRENAGWPVERIGRAFSHNKGHVTRCLERIKELIRNRFNQSDLWIEPEEPLDAPENPDAAPPRLSIHWPDPIDRSPPPNG